jgi:hypothetical protein
MIKDTLDHLGAFVSIGLFTACLIVWFGIAAGV